MSIPSVQSPSVGFMNPSSLKNIMNSENISKEEKVKTLSNEFQKIMVEKSLKDGMKSAFSSKDNPLTSMKGYSETFVPKLAANALPNAFGLTEQLSQALLKD